MNYKPFCTSPPECHGSLVKVSIVQSGFQSNAMQAKSFYIVDVYMVAVKGLGEIAKPFCIIRLSDHEW